MEDLWYPVDKVVAPPTNPKYKGKHKNKLVNTKKIPLDSVKIP